MTTNTFIAAVCASALATTFVLSILFSALIYISYGWDGFKMLPQFMSALR